MRQEIIWVAVNKNGTIMLFAEKPERKKKEGIWFSKFPYCNCIAEKEIKNIINHVGMNWEHEPEPFPVEIK